MGKMGKGDKTEKMDSLYKSLIVSMAICVPFFCLTILLMESKFFLRSPSLTMLVIMGLAAANFAVIIFLEYYRSKISQLTIPTLLIAISAVLLFVIAEGVNRFFRDFGFQWLFPVVAAYGVLSVIAIFKERIVWAKCVLGVNAVAMGALWGLGLSDKVALPF